MQNIIRTVGVLVYGENDEVLLVTHKDSAGHVKGIYGLPAGRIDDGESGVEAAKRELKEETGLYAELSDLEQLPKEYTAEIPRADGTTKNFHMIVFLCKNHSGSLTDEFETVPERVKISELGNYKLLPNVEEIILDNR